MTNEERMKKGYLWLDTGESMDLQIHQRSLIYDFNHTRPDDLERRQELLKQIFGHLGEGVWVEPPLSASFGCTDTIGDRTYINSNLNLVDDLGITIGSDVLIAPNVTLINTGHPLRMSRSAPASPSGKIPSSGPAPSSFTTSQPTPSQPAFPAASSGKSETMTRSTTTTTAGYPTARACRKRTCRGCRSETSFCFSGRVQMASG